MILPKLIGNTKGKILLKYKKRAEKMTIRKMSFLLYRKIGFTVKEER